MHAEAPAAPGLVVREADGVPVLELPADLEFEALRDWLDAQLPGAAEAIGGRSGRLDLGDRILQLFDLRRLLHHLEDAHDLQITGLYSTADAVHAFAQKELKLRLGHSPLFRVVEVDPWSRIPERRHALLSFDP